MRINEVVAARTTPNVAEQGVTQATTDVKTAFEKNVTKLRGKVRRLKPKKPIKPVQHGP